MKRQNRIKSLTTSALLAMGLMVLVFVSIQSVYGSAVYEISAEVVPGANGGDGPGGVGDTTSMSDLNLWLNANTITVTNGNLVAIWPDSSDYGIVFSQTNVSMQPTLSQDLLEANGQKVVRFSNKFLSGGDNLDFQRDNPHSMFIVLQDNFSNDGSVFNKVSNIFDIQGWDYFLRFGGDTYHILANDYPDDALSLVYTPGSSDSNFHIEDFTYDGSLSTTGYGIWRDGVLQITSDDANLLTGDTTNSLNVQIGGRNSSGGYAFGGDVGEIVVYTTTLTNTQRILVENYLSAKYDTVLDTANGAIDVYDGDTIANGDFDFNVAGIGRIDDFSHTQAHAAGMIVVDNTFLQDDGDWLLFGHNTSVNSNSPDNLPTTGDWDPPIDPQRWDRHFYIDVTDAAGTDCSVTTCLVDIIFDYGEGGMDGDPLKMPSAPESNYRLLKQANLGDDFTDITASVNSVVISGDQVQFLGVDVAQLGSSFTLGTLDAGTSPTAVTLNSFTTDNQSVNLFAVLLVGLLTLGLGSLWLRRRTER